jgi:hypothetical protein
MYVDKAKTSPAAQAPDHHQPGGDADARASNRKPGALGNLDGRDQEGMARLNKRIISHCRRWIEHRRFPPTRTTYWCPPSAELVRATRIRREQDNTRGTTLSLRVAVSLRLGRSHPVTLDPRSDFSPAEVIESPALFRTFNSLSTGR